jgi:hypothetical protein
MEADKVSETLDCCSILTQLVAREDFIEFTKILHYTKLHNSIEWFSACPNITSNFRTIATSKSFVKQNNDSNKTCRYIHDILLYETLLSNVKWIILVKQILNFKLKRPLRSHFSPQK